jgi:hypothetical protein
MPQQAHAPERDHAFSKPHENAPMHIVPEHTEPYPVVAQPGGARALDYAAGYVDHKPASAADTASATVLDTELKIVAKKLSTSLPELAAAVAEVGMWNGHIAELRTEHQEAERKLRRYRREASEGDEYQAADARNKVREWTRKRDTAALQIGELDSKRHVAIAKARDGVLRKALDLVTREVARIRDQGKAMALGEAGEGVQNGLDYVGHVLRQVRAHAADLELAGNQTDPVTGKAAFGGLEQQAMGELTAAETTVAELRTAMGVRYDAGVSSLDVEKELASFEGDVVNQHFDAAKLQVDALERGLVGWGAIAPGRGPAEGQYDEIVATMSAVETHVDGALAALDTLDPAGRKKLRARLATLKKSVDKAHKKSTDKRGGSPASVGGRLEAVHAQVHGITI